MQRLGLLRLGRAWHIIDETHFYTYETGTMDNQEGNDGNKKQGDDFLNDAAAYK